MSAPNSPPQPAVALLQGTAYAFIPITAANVATSASPAPIYAYQWPGLQIQNTASSTPSSASLYHAGTEISLRAQSSIQMNERKRAQNSYDACARKRPCTDLPSLPPIDPVLNTSPTQSKDSAMASRPPDSNLLALPAEMRLEAYRHLFRNSQMDVHKRNMLLIDPNDEFSVYELLKVNISILKTCSFLRNEAIPSLNASTTLNINNSFHRSDPLAGLPDQFLKDIRTIRVEVDAFVHIKRARIPALRQVNLVHEVEGLESFARTVGAMLKAKDLMNDAMSDVIDWRWRLNQFAHLGAEEGFAINMTVMLDCYSEGPEARIDIDVDLVSGTLVGLKGFIGSQEVAVADQRQAELDWAAYGKRKLA